MIKKMVHGESVNHFPCYTLLQKHELSRVKAFPIQHQRVPIAMCAALDLHMYHPTRCLMLLALKASFASLGGVGLDL